MNMYGDDLQRVKIPVSKIRKLRKDPKFILILRLSRYINQLAFCESAFQTSLDEPARGRQKQNAFLFSCGVLYEALKFYPELGKEFHQCRAYRDGFGKLKKNEHFSFVRDHVVKKMRNEFVFHVDDGPFRTGLQQYGDRSVNFLVTADFSIERTHLVLADELVLNYLIGEHNSDAEALEYFRVSMEKVLQISRSFVKCGVAMVNEYVHLLRLKFEPIKASPRIPTK